MILVRQRDGEERGQSFGVCMRLEWASCDVREKILHVVLNHVQ